MLHEIVTDMGLALNLRWLFSLYIDFMLDLGIKPGFETRNFAFLVKKFKEWNIDFREVMIAAPFNEVGFQMTPSKVECEQALTSLPEPNVVAISILASGYLNLSEAAKYIKSLPNLKGFAVGISKEKHARETFRFLRDDCYASKCAKCLMFSKTTFPSLNSCVILTEQLVSSLPTSFHLGIYTLLIQIRKTQPFW